MPRRSPDGEPDSGTGLRASRAIGDSRTNGSVGAQCRWPSGPGDDAGLRIGDAAARAGVSTRTLRYYEELGLLEPSARTAGGERRYEADDIVRLERIIECKDLLGMNLEEIRVLLSSRSRLDELRVAYRAHADSPANEAKERRRAILEEALALQTSLVERMDSKLARLAAFRAEAHADAEHCAALLQQLA